MKVEPIYQSRKSRDSQEHHNPPKKDTVETSEFQSILNTEISKITQSSLAE